MGIDWNEKQRTKDYSQQTDQELPSRVVIFLARERETPLSATSRWPRTVVGKSPTGVRCCAECRALGLADFVWPTLLSKSASLCL